MSDENNTPKKQTVRTQELKRTSAVPLRKETVRVTLKAPGAKPGVPKPNVEPPVNPNTAPQPSKAATVKLGTAGASAPTIPLGGAVPPPAPPAPNGPPPTTTSVRSSVPLKQETMRVTLKADKSGAPGVPGAASAPPAPSTPAPAPTVPLGTSAPAPSAPIAPTIPMSAPSGPATTPITQPLNTQRSGSSPLATQRLSTSPLATQQLSAQPLPKATVQLQQTQQLTQGLGTVQQNPSIQRVVDDEEAARKGNGGALPLSIVAFLLSLVVLYFCFEHTKIWVEKDEEPDYARVFEELRNK